MNEVQQKLSFVIPCYYSENTILNVLQRIKKTVEDDGRYDYEIICVNDGSTDGTYAVLREQSLVDSKIKVLDLSRNFGQHAALMAGFNYVSGDIIVCLDDDGQNPPEEMFLLIDKCNEGYDLVSAKYAREKKRGLIRKIGSKVSFLMSRQLISMPKDIELNSYYCMKRFVVDEIIKYENPYPFVHGLALRVTRNIANVEMRRDERLDGESGYNFKSLFKLWMNGFTAFSVKPLRVASIAGIVFAILGFLSMLFIIIEKLLGNIKFAGYASTVSIILFFSGMIMMFLGMIGEYIGRLYICVNNAPQFAVRHTCNLDEKRENTD